MKRTSAALLAFTAVGALAAATVVSKDAFVMGFFFVFWGGISAAIMWIASRNWSLADDIDPICQGTAKVEGRPFFDETGVHRFHGDVFDVENHPRAGAEGRN